MHLLLVLIVASLMACGPDPGSSDGGDGGRRDGRVDSDGPRSCAFGCPECTTCSDGTCVPADERRPCSIGTCWGGVCCDGCWDGTACQSGGAMGACGAAGAECAACSCAGDACVDGACVPTVRASTVTAGELHTCAISEPGALFCFGQNTRGTVGDGSDATLVLTPTRVGDATSVAAGAAHTCAVDASGQTSCWGAADRGQLGTDDFGPDRTTPTVVTALEGTRMLAVGAATSCAIDEGGKARCFGAGEAGQLGVGVVADQPAPLLMPDAAWSSFAMGELHACAIQTDGSLWCWGANRRGQLGLGSSGLTGAATPQLVDAVMGFSLVTAGLAHTCARADTGVIMCWGDGSRGQLGTGNRNDRNYVWPIVGSLRLDALDAGDRHTCGISPSGFIICWGANDGGQLGTNDTVDRTEPTLASLRSPWVVVTAGGHHTCGIDAAGALYCWGANTTGQLGTGDTESRAFPTRTCLIE